MIDTSEPQARLVRRPGSGAGARTGRAHDDLLAFLDVAPQHLGGRAVTDAEGDLHALRLAVGVEQVDAAGRGAAAAAPSARAGALIELHLLLGREDLANPR